LLLQLLITFSNVVVLIFAARNSLAFQQTYSQRHINIITILALLALRKPLQQRPKMRPVAQPQPRAATTTKLESPTHMKRAQDVRVAEAPNLGVRAQCKVELTQRDRAPHEATQELRDEHAQHQGRLRCDGLCDILGPRRVQTGV